MENFIELNRTFYQLPADYSNKATSDNLNITDALNNHFGGNWSWEGLLNKRRVILLAEAGAGKTQEILHATTLLRSKGKTAFFLRLEHIAKDLETSFEVGTYEEFQDWISSLEEGWLLLDSVDEARLKDPKDFERAIRKLSSLISPALQRVYIIITSRITAWRPKTDIEFCNTRLKYNEIRKKVDLPNSVDTDNENSMFGALDGSEAIMTTSSTAENISGFKVYSLNDLTKDQVTIFVKAKGVSDQEKLLDEIGRQDAWAFTTRPQDLDELLGYWNENHRIGTRFELMKHSINRRIEERDQDRAVTYLLARDKARKGVQLLAVACTLINESVIKVPDNDYRIGLSPGIDANSILHDWNDSESQTLLSRPIFDEAIYGTVRFHHRSVREYLTAEWLSEKLKEAGSRQKIESLFFRKQYGLEVIVPSMKPILSWLVLFDSKIMQKVYRLEPEIILEGGDPTRLPLDNRKEVLRSICKRIASGTSNRSMDERSSVQRFVSSDLVEEVKRLIEEYTHNQRVVYFLLQLVLHGRMHQALQEAVSFALNQSSETYVRVTAIETVKLLGAVEDLERIKEAILIEVGPLDKWLLSELINGLDSNENSVKWLLTALENVQTKGEYESEGLSYSLLDFINRSDESILYYLINGIDKLLRSEPVFEHRYCEISKKYGWLLPISLKAVERLVYNRNMDALRPESLFALIQMPGFEHYSHFWNNPVTHDLSNLIPAWKELNHSLFWHAVEVTRTHLHTNGEPLRNYWQIAYFESYWKFNEADFDLINQDISTRELQDDQFIALSLAFQIYNSYNRPNIWLADLKEAVSGSESLETRLEEFLRPPNKLEIRKYKQQEAKWKRRREEQEKKKKENHDEWVVWLKQNYEKLRDNGLEKGKVSDSQQYLFYHRDRVNKGVVTSSLSNGRWEDLIEEYGVDVAEAYKDGLLSFWRGYIPCLLSEKDPGNSISLGLMFGLAGLEIEAASGLDSFSKEDAELACRYAFQELNGFPNWFYQLYINFPDIVTSLVCKEIKWELETAETRMYVLSKIGWNTEWLWNHIAPKLIEYLRNEPLNVESLSSALRIIQGSSIVSDQEISDLAARKCTTIEAPENISCWFAVWIGVEPERALPGLASYLQDLYRRDVENAKYIVMEVAVHLVGRRHTAPSVRKNFQEPKYLKDLYLLMHNYIKVEEDIDRAGTGVYSPGLRDYAQEARENLFSILKEVRGKESYLAMSELSERHPVEQFRLRMLRNAKERAERDTENSSWTWEKVKEFTRSLESTPANHRELFDLGVQRLKDLKYQLEEGDDSIASTLIKENQETGIRKVIASWCRERATGKYNITQEEELADAKRPDCRFLGSGIDAPVPVELKLADNWPGSKLFERLENQLCGDYLRDSHSNCGIFVLVYRGEKYKWTIPNGSKVPFAELVEALQNHWEQLSPKFPKIEQIAVIGIDLTKRAGK